MAFNLLNAMTRGLTYAGALFPGWAKGREDAIQANWKDIQNYDTEQDKQINNLFSAATFNDRVNNSYMNRLNNAITLGYNNRQNFLNYAQLPYLMDAAAFNNRYGGDILRRQYEQLLRGGGPGPNLGVPGAVGGGFGGINQGGGISGLNYGR